MTTRAALLAVPLLLACILISINSCFAIAVCRDFGVSTEGEGVHGSTGPQGLYDIAGMTAEWGAQAKACADAKLEAQLAIPECDSGCIPLDLFSECTYPEDQQSTVAEGNLLEDDSPSEEEKWAVACDFHSYGERECRNEDGDPSPSIWVTCYSIKSAVARVTLTRECFPRSNITGPPGDDMRLSF